MKIVSQFLRRYSNNLSTRRATQIRRLPGRGGLPYDFHGGVPRIRVIFLRKNSEKGMSFFHKNSGKGYNICKKFQIGSVILMTQMTNQKNTELIDFFDLVWTKNPHFLENVLTMEAIFFQNSPQNRILEASIGHKNSEKGPTFSSKIPERVDKETL